MIGQRTASTTAADPRLSLDAAQQQALALRAQPAVARPPRASDSIGLALGVLGALGLGALTLLGLSGQRTQAATAAPAAVETAAIPSPQPQPVIATPAPPAAPATPVAVAAPIARPDPNQPDPGQSRAMPLVIDNSDAAAPTVAGGRPASQSETDARNGLSADELFAMRSTGDAPPVAHADMLGDHRNTVVQGTILPAVLETAVNSDLPGYARAIISRDVRGFDGSSVLIPRGSRLIGQYKSGLAAGQSRAYIMWTRLLRPDGVSVQLGSPAMDTGGEIGLPGEVNRHFWQRFGASILLSVVSGLASATGSDGSVVVASSGAQSAAGVALESNGKIPPTIRIPLGTPIQVFVARDLAFPGQPVATACPAGEQCEVRR
ncbi:MAG: TrbI/VirB10 family protein [Thermomonas sp.]|uniref:TrbI/VirB10 family protein n=1 Tax=Thermomonas sp. TaxID=1971895 RepID=UPI0039E55CB0